MKETIRIHWPGILLLFITLLVGLLTYQDYGMVWDEPEMRKIGLINYNYIYNNDLELLSFVNKDYGPFFELLLVHMEKWMGITDTRDIYLMRHIATHLYFFISLCFFYVLGYRLFKNRFLACLCLLMFVLAPRIYTHSFFNTKDLPFLSTIVMALTMCTIAFQTRRLSHFLIAGMFCGLAAGIRVMGVMLPGYVGFFLFIELINTLVKKENSKKVIGNLVAFVVAFSLSLYAVWPNLWGHPVSSLVESFRTMSHFRWSGAIFMNGKFEFSDNIPWFIFPVWFVITNPLLWLVSGFAGIVWICVDFFKKPMVFLRNTDSKIFLLFLLCCVTPAIGVIALRAVIYEDWRHLFFVYPSFLIVAAYFINKVYQTKFRVAVVAACIVQLVVTGYTMYGAYPFNNVYFNPVVSHDKEYLRKHYEMDYWGSSFKDGLEYLISQRRDGEPIIVTSDRAGLTPMEWNLMLLQPRDRERIKIVNKDVDAEYFLTEFRGHPEDYPYPVKYYSIEAFNSTVLCIYKLK